MLTRFTFILVAAWSTLACSSTTLVNSIDDLTAQVDQQGFLSLEQQRILSLSGLVPSGPPGSVYRYDGSRSPFTAIGFSEEAWKPDAEPDDPKRRSYYVTRTIESKASLEELLALRMLLVDVRLFASQIINLRLERILAGGQETPDTARVSSLSTKIDTAQGNFDNAWKAVVEGVNQPGVFIARTDRKESTSLGAKIGSILGFGSESSSATGGFAILSGLRTSFLYLGDDLASDHWPKPPSRDWNLIGKRFPYLVDTYYLFGVLPLPIIPGQWSYEECHVVTSKLEAQQVLYLRDQTSERRIQANLTASADQLSKLGKALMEVDEIAIEAVLDSVESLGNVGIIGESVEERSYPYGVNEVFVRVEQANKWQTVYQVFSEYDDLRTVADGKPRWHLTNWD